MSWIILFNSQSNQSSKTGENWVSWAVVVAQLADGLLTMREVHGSNPVMGKICHEDIYCSVKKSKENERGREWPFKKLRGDIIASNHSHPLFGQFS